MNVSMPMLLKASTYSVRFTFVMTFGTPMWLAYMEMMRFSSSIFVNVMTASVELMPSAARMSCREPSASMMTALGSSSASSTQRSWFCSMILTPSPACRQRMAS